MIEIQPHAITFIWLSRVWPPIIPTKGRISERHDLKILKWNQNIVGWLHEEAGVTSNSKNFFTANKQQIVLGVSRFAVIVLPKTIHQSLGLHTAPGHPYGQSYEASSSFYTFSRVSLATQRPHIDQQRTPWSLGLAAGSIIGGSSEAKPSRT